MLEINLFNQCSHDKEKSTTSRKNSVLQSLGKTENKIKNHNDNPADIQVDCLFPNMTSQRKQQLLVPRWKKINKQKLTYSSPTVTTFHAMPCSRACLGHVAMFQEASPCSGGIATFQGVSPHSMD